MLNEPVVQVQVDQKNDLTLTLMKRRGGDVLSGCDFVRGRAVGDPGRDRPTASLPRLPGAMAQQ